MQPTNRIRRDSFTPLPVLLVAAALLVGAPRADAQTVIGVLINESTGEPVGRAYVVLLDTDSIEVTRGFADGLGRFFQAFATMLHERPEVPALFVREAVSTGIDPAVVPHLLEIIGITRRLAERGRREGRFREVDPLLLHFGVVGALSFFFATEPARRRLKAEGRVPFEMPSADDFVRHIQEMTLRGLAPGPSPTPEPNKRKGARS